MTYLPIDNSGFVNCSLYIDDIVFLGNQSDIVNGSNNTILRDNFTEGHYNWTVECVDLSLDTHRPTARNFTVDLNAMLIDLNAPANNTDFATSSVNVNFTATDSIDTSLSCNVTLNDDTVYSTVAAANGTLTNVLVTALPDGNTTWDVTCVDDAGHTNTSETRIIDVAEPPRIFLNSTNDSYFSSSTANLFYTPHDNSNVTSCDLYINDVFNQTNASIIALGAQNSFEVNGLVDGRYNWSVNCTDIVSTTNVSETRIFTVDSVDPTITLHYPDGHQVFAVNITFNFTVVDLYDDSLTCNLTVDSGIEAQNVAVLNNTVSNQTISGITDGYHTWFMNCSDNAGNVGNSLVYNFTRVTVSYTHLTLPTSG